MSHLYPIEELKKDMAIYYGMVSFMDKNIGKIINKLDQMGELDNTIIIFTTDHGHFIGQHGLIAKGPSTMKICSVYHLLLDGQIKFLKIHHLHLY